MVARWLLLIGVAIAALLASSCSRPGGQAGTEDAGAPPPFRIGVMTGSVSQGEEDFRAGQQLRERYGPRLLHITHPDDFVNERQTVVAQIAGLASHPELRVICIGQAIPGSVEAARRVRAMRPDIRIGLVSPHEDPDSLSGLCDLSIDADQLARGPAIVATARAMGALHLVHYSFPRHMDQALLAKRRDLMASECAARGMGFHDVTAPDPAEDGGLPAAQKFILADVPARIEALGPKTAFYATNDGMQEPLIKALLEHGGYFVEQDVPAPTAGYLAALRLDIPPDSLGNMDYVHGEIRRGLEARGATGRFGTWVAPVDMVALRAATRLLVDSVEMGADPSDLATVKRYLEEESGGRAVRIRRGGGPGNHYLILLEHITY